MHYLLIYEASGDYLERRGEFRALHLKLAGAAVDHGGGRGCDDGDSTRRFSMQLSIHGRAG